MRRLPQAGAQTDVAGHGRPHFKGAVAPNVVSFAFRPGLLDAPSAITLKLSDDIETGLFGSVLHLAVAERPVLRGNLDQADPDVFLANTCFVMDVVRDLFIEGFLYFGRTPGVPRYLDEDDAGRVLNIEIAFLREDQFSGRMGRND